MEFHEKLQQLRRAAGLTQEELAEKLFVSRTAVSKWESGRGLPSIDSLKAISRFFSVSLDDLLSGEAILTLAEDDRKAREALARGRMIAVTDCCAALLIVLPLFGQAAEGAVQSVPLFLLTGAQTPILIAYWTMILSTVALGAVKLLSGARLGKQSVQVSFALGVACTLLLILTRQPYAAVFALTMLIVKALLCRKQS